MALAYRSRGVAYRARGDHDRAIADFGEALRIEPTKLPVLFFDRAMAWAAKGEHDRAIADYSETIGRKPCTPWCPLLESTFNNRALHYRAKGDYDRAIADFSEAIRNDPRAELPLGNRAETYEQMASFDRALADYRTLLAIKTGNQFALESIKRIEQKLAPVAADAAECAKASGDKAIAACTRRIASGAVKGQELALAYEFRGLAHRAKGDYDRAIVDFSEALQIDSTGAARFFNRAIAWAGKGDHESAIADYGETIQRKPCQPWCELLQNAINNRGHSYFMKGDYDRALADFSEVIRNNPRAIQSLGNRVATYERIASFDRALADSRTILAIDPANQFALESMKRIEQKLAAIGTVKPVVATPTPQTLAIVPGRRVALVVGNDNYEHLPKLQKAVNDARSVADRLAKLGFEVIRLENATRRQMNEKLSELTGKIGRGDTAFFFYAGHGVEIKNTNYLLATDTPAAREGQEGLIPVKALRPIRSSNACRSAARG